MIYDKETESLILNNIKLIEERLTILELLITNLSIDPINKMANV